MLVIGSSVSKYNIIIINIYIYMIFTAMTKSATRCVHDDDEERLPADPNIILTTTLHNITENPMVTARRVKR